MAPHRAIIILTVLGLTLAAAAPGRGRPAGAPASLESILAEPTLWGRDFPEALAHLKDWARVGERTVAIFSGQVAGTIPYRSNEDARRTAGNLAPGRRAVRPALQDKAASWLKEAWRRPARAFRAEIGQSLDDDTYRVAQVADGVELLPPALNMAQVRRRIGPPEQTAVEIVHAEGDRRPVDLTLHRYAGGRVVFVETDLVPEPGRVDRVLLDVAAVAAALLKEAR